MRMNQKPPMTATAEDLQDAERHEREREAHADPAGDVGRLTQGALPLPEGGAQDPPAVEREAGDEIEDPDRDVHQHEVGDHRLRPRRLHETAGVDRPQHRRDGEARDRPHHRDQELGPRARRLILEVRDAAEHVQGDPADGEPVRHRHE